MSFIENLKKNSKEIEDWYHSSIFDEDSDYIYSPLRLKIIKNPKQIRDDLLTLDLFKSNQIRTITNIIFSPGVVYTHNHKNNSYFVYDKQKQEYIFFPVENNISYKTTHFTIQSNKDAYLLHGDRKIYWEKNIFNKLNVIDVNHSAVNNGQTPVKFLYIDYYEYSF